MIERKLMFTPNDSSSHQQQYFYLVVFPFLELPELKLVKKEFTKNHQIHSEIIDSLKTKRRDQSVVLENIKCLSIGKKTYKERCNETSRRLSWNCNSISRMLE
jgi:hypothetical protein